MYNIEKDSTIAENGFRMTAGAAEIMQEIMETFGKEKGAEIVRRIHQTFDLENLLSRWTWNGRRLKLVLSDGRKEVEIG